MLLLATSVVRFQACQPYKLFKNKNSISKVGKFPQLAEFDNLLTAFLL